MTNSHEAPVFSPQPLLADLVISDTARIRPEPLPKVLKRAMWRNRMKNTPLAERALTDRSTIFLVLREKRLPSLRIAGSLLVNAGASRREMLAAIAYYGLSVDAPRQFYSSNGLETQTGSFAEQLNGYLKQIPNLSNRALAARTGIDHSALSRIRREDRGVGLKIGARIIQGLGRLDDNQRIQMFLAPYNESVAQRDTLETAALES